jgi:hypothetical protein
MNQDALKKTRSILIATILSLIIISQAAATHFNYVVNEDEQLLRKYNQSSSQEVYDLIIITPYSFVSELRPLMFHKNKVGIKTKIVTLSEVYRHTYWQGRDKAEKIKYFIKNAYDNWGIKYVLLIGGIKKQFSQKEQWWLPVRYSYLQERWTSMPGYWETRFISDLYFADIYNATGDFCSWDSDGDGVFGEWFNNNSAEDILDLYPEVYVGRLPCRNSFELRIVVKKIINYESKRCDDSWFNNMVVVAGDTYPGDDEFEGEIITQRALDKMTGFNQIKLWTSNGNLTGPKDIMQSIKNGCGFLFLFAHGSPLSCSAHPPNETTWIDCLNIFNVPLLFNNGKLPICVSGGCYTNQFNVTFSHTVNNPMAWFECLGWHLTRKVGGGSIATLGNTGLALISDDKLDPGVGGGTGDLNIFVFEEYGQNGTDILGELWGGAICSYLLEHPILWNQNSYNDSAIDAKVVEQFVLIGDPSLKVGGYIN